MKTKTIKAWAVVNMGRIETLYSSDLLKIYETKKQAKYHKGYDEVCRVEIKILNPSN